MYCAGPNCDISFLLGSHFLFLLLQQQLSLCNKEVARLDFVPSFSSFLCYIYIIPSIARHGNAARPKEYILHISSDARVCASAAEQISFSNKASIIESNYCCVMILFFSAAIEFDASYSILSV